MTFEPTWRIPPGELLAEELHARAMAPLSLASETGLSLESVQDLLSGELELSVEIAGRLEQALGISAVFWTRMEAAWRSPLPVLDVPGHIEVDDGDLPSLGDTVLVGMMRFVVESDRRTTFRNDERSVVWEMVLRASARAPLGEL